MARRRSHVEEFLRYFERLSEIEQCEILEQIYARTRSPEDLARQVDQMRARMPRRSERVIRRDVDRVVREVRRELAANSRR